MPEPLPQRLVDTLDQFFPGYTIVLFTGPSYELFIQNPENRARSISTLFYQPVFSNKSRNGGSKMEQYWDQYYHDDPGQPVNLPVSLREKTLVCYSEISAPATLRGNQFDQFLAANGLSTKATIYLHQENVCLAGITMCRADDRGAFSQEECELFELMGQAIAPLYLAYLRESYYANIAAIYRTYYEPDDIGLALVTTRAELIEANTAIQKFGAQIAERIAAKDGRGTVPQSGKEESSPLPGIVRMLIRTQTPVTSCIERTLVFGDDRFHCMLKPCMLTGLSTDIHTLYVLRITKDSGAGKSVPASAAKQYQLTNREMEIANLLVSGFKTEQISKTLYISRNTVKNHISNIFKKMDVTSRVELLGKLNQ